MSNPDADHIGGFLDVFDAFEVDTVYVSGDPKGTLTYNTFLRSAREEGSDFEVVRAGRRMDWGGVQADVIAPPPQGELFSEKVNPASINATTFKLYKCSSTNSTNCSTQLTNVLVSLSTDGLGTTLNPYGNSSTLLASKTKYKAVVTTGVTDEAGNVLDQDSSVVGNQQKVWYFTTGRT